MREAELIQEAAQISRVGGRVWSLASHSLPSKHRWWATSHSSTTRCDPKTEKLRRFMRSQNKQVYEKPCKLIVRDRRDSTRALSPTCCGPNLKRKEERKLIILCQSSGVCRSVPSHTTLSINQPVLFLDI